MQPFREESRNSLKLMAYEALEERKLISIEESLSSENALWPGSVYLAHPVLFLNI